MVLTNKQQQVLGVLQQSVAPLSAYALLAQLGEHGFNAPTQVYRVLHKLIEFGLVRRLESLHAYTSCAPSKAGKSPVSAFVICRACGQARELEGGLLDECLGQKVRSEGFALEKVTVEVFGICASCN